jgi:hypothetical protein
LPHKEYQPIRHFLPPKEYLPTNLNSYKEPGYDLKLPEYVPLPDQTLVPPQSNIQAPNSTVSLLSEHQLDKALAAVPAISTSYLPPSEGYSPPADYYLPPPPKPEEIEDHISHLDELIDGLTVPSRGPQFPVKDEFKLSSGYLGPEAIKSKYKEPPPRASITIKEELEAPSVLNSQGIPPTSFVDKYIPPRTKYDVPKNFKRPGQAIDLLEGSDADLPEPPAPEEIPDIDEGLIEVEELQQIAELPREAFLGLAKLKKPDSGDKEKSSKLSNKSKPAKLTLDKGPKLPPMPTLPPQPGKYFSKFN